MRTLAHHDDIFQPNRPVDRPRNGRKDDNGQILQEKGDADGADQGRNSRRVAQGPIGHPIDKDADTGRHQDGPDDRQRPGQVKQGDGPEDKIGPQHENLAMGKVDQPQDAVDHGIADGDQGIKTAKGQSVQ